MSTQSLGTGSAAAPSSRPDAIDDGALRTIVTLLGAEFIALAVRLGMHAYRDAEASRVTSAYDDHASRFVLQAWTNAVDTGGAWLGIFAVFPAWVLMRRSERWITYNTGALLCLVVHAVDRVSVAIAPLYWEHDSVPRIAAPVGSVAHAFAPAVALGLAVFVLAEGSRERLRARPIVGFASLVTLFTGATVMVPTSFERGVGAWVGALVCAAIAVSLAYAIHAIDRTAIGPGRLHDEQAADRAARGVKAIGWSFALRLGIAMAITAYIRQSQISRREEQVLAQIALGGSVLTDVFAAWGFFRLTALPGSPAARTRAAYGLAALAMLLGADLRTIEVFFGQHGYGADRPFWFAQAMLVASVAMFASTVRIAMNDRGLASRTRVATWGSRLLFLALGAGLFAQWNNQSAASARSAMAFGVLVGGVGLLLGLVLSLLAARGFVTVIRTQSPVASTVGDVSLTRMAA